jgi:hypothetical protein
MIEPFRYFVHGHCSRILLFIVVVVDKFCKRGLLRLDFKGHLITFPRSEAFCLSWRISQHFNSSFIETVTKRDNMPPLFRNQVDEQRYDASKTAKRLVQLDLLCFATRMESIDACSVPLLKCSHCSEWMASFNAPFHSKGCVSLRYR